MATEIPHKKPDLFDGDLSPSRLEEYLKSSILAVDTETRGLNLHRDRLCLTQLCDSNGVVSFVRYKNNQAPNLKKLLEAQSCLKIFHFGRFDITFLHQYLGIKVNPVFCTKISSKLLRTYTDRHSLKDLVKEYLGVELSKADQCSDWAREDLSESQLDYAANDVRVLIPIHEIMSNLLVRENLTDLAQAAFKSLPLICEFDRRGYKDVFEH